MSLNNICKAYGNPKRVQLIVCLSQKVTVSDLLKKCHLSQSALSQHLAVLRKAKVVTTHRSGTYIYYKTASPAYVRLAKMIINVTK